MYSGCRQFVLSLVLFLHVYVGALVAEPALPAFKNDRERVAYLIYLQQIIPDIFQESARHGGDLLEAIMNQEKIQRLYQSDEKFQTLWREHGPELMQLAVQVTGSTEVRARVLNPEALKKWRQGLESILASSPESADPRTFLIKQIQARLKKMGGVKADALRGALLSTLPKEVQKEVSRRKLTLDQTDQYLREEAKLPKDLVAHGFRPEVFGLSEKGITVKKMLSLLQSAPKIESELAQLVQAYALLRNDGEMFPSRDQALQKMLHLSEGDIDTFIDHEIYMKKLQVLAEDLGMDLKKVASLVGGPTIRTRGHAAVGKQPASLPKTVSTGPVAKAVTALTSQRVEKVEHLTGDLTLQEVPPHISIFRGCVGGDCSTTHSADVPNAPMERVFFVRNPKGELKGQVSTTIVTLPDGKRALYVHTIAGKRISAADTLTILHGLYEGKSELGVDEVALIHESRVSANNNYQPVREGFRIARQGMPVKNINYLDAEARTHLRARSYDSPESNTLAYVYTPTPSEGTKVLVNKSAHKLPAFETLPVTKEVVLKFAVDLSMIEDPDEKNIRRVLRVLDKKEERISERDLNRIKNTLANRRQIPLGEYYNAAKGEFAKHGVVIDDKFVDERQFWFAAGHINSSSVANPEEFKLLPEHLKQQTVDFVIETLTDADRLEDSTLKVIKSNREYFQKAPRFLNYLERLASSDAPDKEDLRQLAGLLNLKLDIADLTKRLAAIPQLVNSTEEGIAEAAGLVATKVSGWSSTQKQEMARGIFDDDLGRVNETIGLLRKVGVEDGKSQVRLLELYFSRSEDAPYAASSLGKNSVLSPEASAYLANRLAAEGEKDEITRKVLSSYATNDVDLVVREMRVENDSSFQEGVKKSLDPKREAPAEFRRAMYERLRKMIDGEDLKDREAAIRAVERADLNDASLAAAMWNLIEKLGNNGPSYYSDSSVIVLSSLDSLGDDLELRLAKVVVNADTKSRLWRLAKDILERVPVTSTAAHNILIDAMLNPSTKLDSLEAIGRVAEEFKNLSLENQRRMALALGSFLYGGANGIVRNLKGSKDPLVLQRILKYALSNNKAYFSDDIPKIFKYLRPLPAPIRLMISKALSDPGRPRVNALQLLAESGNEDPAIATRLLEEAMRETHSRNDHFLIQVLQQSPLPSAESLQKLFTMARTGPKNKKLLALELLGHVHPTPEGESILIDAFTGKEEESRAVACNALTRYLGGGDTKGSLSAEGYRRLSAAAHGNSALMYNMRQMLAHIQPANVDVQLLMLEAFASGKEERRNLQVLQRAHPRDPRFLSRLIDIMETTTTEDDRRHLVGFFSVGDPRDVQPFPIETLRKLASVLHKLPRTDQSRLIAFFGQQKINDPDISRTLATFLAPEAEKENFVHLLTILSNQKEPNPALVEAAFSVANVKMDWRTSEKFFETMTQVATSNAEYQDRLLEAGLQSKGEGINKFINALPDSAWENPRVLSRLRKIQNVTVWGKLEKVAKETENPDTLATLMYLHYLGVKERLSIFNDRAVFDDEVYVAMIHLALERKPNEANLGPLKKLIEYAQPDSAMIRRALRKGMESASDEEKIVALHIAASLQTSGAKLRQKMFELADSESERVRSIALWALSKQTGLNARKVSELVERSHARGDVLATELYSKNAKRIEAGTHTRAHLLNQMERGDNEARGQALTELGKLDGGFTEEQLLRVADRVSDAEGNNNYKAIVILNKYSSRLPISVQRLLIEKHKVATPDVANTLLSVLHQTKPAQEVGEYFLKLILKTPWELPQDQMAFHGIEKFPDLIRGLETKLATKLRGKNLVEKLFAIRLLVASPDNTTPQVRKLKLQALKFLKELYLSPLILKYPSGHDEHVYDRSTEVAYFIGALSKIFPEETREFLEFVDSDEPRMRELVNRIVAANKAGPLVSEALRQKVAARLVDMTLGGGNERYTAGYLLGELQDAAPSDTKQKLLAQLANGNVQDAQVVVSYFVQMKTPDPETHDALIAAYERFKKSENSDYVCNQLLEAAEATATHEQMQNPTGRLRIQLAKLGQLCVAGFSILGLMGM